MLSASEKGELPTVDTEEKQRTHRIPSVQYFRALGHSRPKITGSYCILSTMLLSVFPIAKGFYASTEIFY